ncbi:MAG: HDIG domain-containing protein [Candidatus Altiarchaeales archaeon]|nr:HDIG domain-containing protein [Candidatus Altiarchaeales archaeon]
MDYERALKLVVDSFGDGKIARHCIATSKKAVEIAEKIKANGHEVDLELVKVGALLHDIGRARTHDIEHNYEGSVMLRELGFEELARAVERHGANIFEVMHPKEMTLEEKIIYIADKLTEEDEYVNLDERFRKVVERRKKHGKIDEIRQIEKAIKITKEIEEEINKLAEGANKQ